MNKDHLALTLPDIPELLRDAADFASLTPACEVVRHHPTDTPPPAVWIVKANDPLPCGCCRMRHNPTLMCDTCLTALRGEVVRCGLRKQRWWRPVVAWPFAKYIAWVVAL